MHRLTSHRPPRHLFAVAGLGFGILIHAAASADVVQGTVTPANAKVVIKDSAGNQVSELAAGPFQVRLPAGRFTAECQPPSQKKVQIFSLAQPTTVNIDCT
jgi:phosphate-selective porin